MRFLFVDSSKNGWGTEQHLVCLARELSQAGHAVAAVVKLGSPVARLLANSGVRLYPTLFRGGADPRGLVKIVGAVREHSPHWLVANRSQLYWPLWVIARSQGVQVALFRHLPYIRNWSRRCLMPRLADRFFVVSHFARTALAAAGAPAASLQVLHNPIDVHRFRPDPRARNELRQSLGLAPDAVLAGFVGRIEKVKGVLELRNALLSLLPQLTKLHFVWIGDGGERERLQTMAAGTVHRCRQHFIDWTPSVERWYAALDFLVAPGIEAETFGRVVAEAQACAVPVIVSGAGGLKEAFHPGRTGLLANPADTLQLQGAIAKLYEDKHLRVRFGAAGRNYVCQHFAAERIAACFIDSLEKASVHAHNRNRADYPDRRPAITSYKN